MGARPKLSLGTWAFAFGPFAAAPWSLQEVCRFAAETGYDGVELNGFRPHAPFEDFDTGGKRRALRAELAALGLGASAYAPDLRTVPPTEVPASDYLRAIDRCVAFCADVDVRLLRVDTGAPPASLPPAEHEARVARLVRTWRVAADRATRDGVTLVWEFEPGFWLDHPADVARMLELVDHPAFRVLFDTSHAYVGALVAARQPGAPERIDDGLPAYARELAPSIGHLHLADSDGTLHEEGTSRHLALGAGVVDFPATLAALGATAHALPWWCVDLCFCPTVTRDAKSALAFARRLLA